MSRRLSAANKDFYKKKTKKNTDTFYGSIMIVQGKQLEMNGIQLLGENCIITYLIQHEPQSSDLLVLVRREGFCLIGVNDLDI